MLDKLLSSTQEKTNQTVVHLKEELATLRTSRANPALIENLMVAAYETQMPLKELAAISAPDTQTLLVMPWDPSIVPNIEKAIRELPLGFNPATFDVNIRVPFPPLTEERRKEFLKLVAQKCEEAKIAVRNIRHEKFKSLDEQCDEGIISENEHARFKKELEKHFEQVNQKIDEIRASKEKELQTL